MTTTPTGMAVVLALATFMCVAGAVSFTYRSSDRFVPRESAPISPALDVPSDPPTDLDGKDSQFLNLPSLKGFNHQDHLSPMRSTMRIGFAHAWRSVTVNSRSLKTFSRDRRNCRC
jgi:hypothetical protein